MYKVIFSVCIAILFLGCKGSLNLPVMDDELEYVEFEDYNSEVAPKLERGYEIIKCDRIKQKTNITVDQFKEKTEKNLAYSKTDILMVDTDIKDGYYNFTACYLKKVDTEKMALGAKLKSDMPMRIREAFGSNKGCTLGKVYYDTPAYKNDLHENDIVKYANNEEIRSCKHFVEILKDNYVLDLVLWADGEEFEVKSIVLNKRF